MTKKPQVQIKITLDPELQEHLHYRARKSTHQISREIVAMLHEHIGCKQAEAANNTILHQFRGFLETEELHLDKFALSLNRVLSKFLDSRRKPT